MNEPENTDLNDALFAGRLFKKLASTPVPAGLEQRILADFDRLAGARGRRPIPAFAGGARRFAEVWAERLWPGAPLWQPASLLALSLAVGLMAGSFVPSRTASASLSTSSDQLVAADTGAAMDFYKDL